MAKKGAAILKQLEGSDLKELNPSLKIHLAPLFGNHGISALDQRMLAKDYVPFLAQLLKACGAKLVSFHSKEDEATAGMADDLFSAMATAIDGLSILRSHLAGSFLEIELQRYALVRRLMNWKKFGTAMSQSMVLYRNLCEITASASTMDSTSGPVASRKPADRGKTAFVPFSCGDSILCPPRGVNVSSELSTLVIGATVDLIWCIAESTEGSLSCFQVAVRLPEQLAPWISTLDPSNASKQRTALFKAMYKSTLTMLADLKTFEGELVEKFCMATLSLCASSPQADQYAKVARRLCSSMSNEGAGWGNRAVAICSAAFSELRSHNALRGIWSSSEFPDLVDCFSRCCQKSNCFSDGWLQITNLVGHIRKVSPGAPVLVVGLYAVGLVLNQADSSQTSPGNVLKDSHRDTGTVEDRRKLELLSEDAEFFSKACAVLRGAEESLTFLLSNAPSEANGTETKTKSLEGSLDSSNERTLFLVNGRAFVSVARALHHVQKPFATFVQNIWKVQSTRSSDQDFYHGSFVSVLGKLLKLFYPVMEKGMRCYDLNDHEKEVFKNGAQMALQALLSSLRISLLLHDDVQENFQLISSKIHQLQPEEQGVLMSSTYNMGVQLFNTKQYELACSPFALANKAAWAKVTSSRSAGSVNDLVSEACAKCLALAESQNRSGDPRASKATLMDGLIQGSKFWAGRLPVKVLHSLLKSYVKLTCIERRAVSDCELEKCTLSSTFGDLQAALPAKMSGLLLEEAHSVCEEMEDQFPDTCKSLKEEITEYLLENLYIGDPFLLERSRILMKKCRESKKCGAEGLPSCISFISEAISCLEVALECGIMTGDSLLQASSSEMQLAVAYLIKGICSYEENPESQEFLPNVVLSINLWRHMLENRGEGLSDREICMSTAIPEDEYLVLLLYTNDLLAIQGYTILCSEVHEVILKVITTQSSTADEWVRLWMDGQRGHFLCATPFSTEFLSSIRRNLGASADPQTYWEGHFSRCPGSLLEAYHHLYEARAPGRNAAERIRFSVEGSEAIQYIKERIRVRLVNEQKSSRSTLDTARLYHLISETYFASGDTHEAFKYAQEAFQLRSGLFKYVYSGIGKRVRGVKSNGATNVSASGDAKILQVREGLSSSAAFSWPLSVQAGLCLSQPSQWTILGDYIESLLQVGIIYERMGAVKEAERSFREGYRLTSAQNLPLGLVSFSLSLGELHRKKQSWETAEGYITQAKEVLDELEPRFCKACMASGRALLHLHSGDLVRHRWYSECDKWKDFDSSNAIDEYSQETLTDALASYTAAVASLSPYLKGLQDGALEERDSVNVRETQIEMLRSLQRKGKEVSVEIMSKSVTETTATRARKSRLRRSVQSVSSRQSSSEVMESNISVLCDDMRSATLVSDTCASARVQVNVRTSHTSGCRNGLRSSKKSCEAVVSLQEGSNDSLGESLEPVTDKKMQEEALFSLPANLRCQSRSVPSECTEPAENWPAYKWTHLAKRITSRVLLQKGKTYANMGELEIAADTCQQAMSILHCQAQSDDTEIRQSLCSVEEGAILYHVSRLWLKRSQQSYVSRSHPPSTTQLSDDLEIGSTQNIRRLYRAFSLCHQVPLLLKKIAKLLALLYIPCAWSGSLVPKMSHMDFSAQQMAEVSAYFHQASLGTAMQQQHLAVLDSKLLEPVDENQQIDQCPAKACAEKMQQALRIFPVELETVGMQAREFWTTLPCNSVCCISFVSTEDANLVTSAGLAPPTDYGTITNWLLVTRVSSGCKPVVVLLPVMPLLGDVSCDPRQSKPGQSFSNPYNLSDDENGDSNSGEQEPGDSKESSPLESLRKPENTKHKIMEIAAPEFRSILEESRLSTSGTETVATTEQKSTWWKWRMELDVRLSVFLRMIEDSWLGPFKCLLLGEIEQEAMAKSFELCTGCLSEMVNSMVCEGQSGAVDSSFVKVLLQAAGSLKSSELESAIARLLGLQGYCHCATHLNSSGADCSECRWKTDQPEKYAQLTEVSSIFRAAYRVSTQDCDNDVLKSILDETHGKRRSRRQVKGKAGQKSQSTLDAILQLAADKSDQPDPLLKREPMQLILDSDAQELPWESLPVMRSQEVYRLPSLGTLHAVRIQQQHSYKASDVPEFAQGRTQPQRASGRKGKTVKRSSAPAADEAHNEKSLSVTSVDPHNTYYILNPSGDLPSTQAAFEKWFTNQPGWKGKAGTVPTAEEYQNGLQNHDLFVYLGHGSGDQFLPERYVRRLNHCAASLLMGCSSGRLSLLGDYEPVGVVLSYLMAGCPTIIANLWDVTDGDIDRFSRFLLHSWLASKPESLSSPLDNGSRELTDRERAMRERVAPEANIHLQSANKVNGRSLKLQAAACEAALEEMYRLGSAMGQSRNACRLPHLIGASPVCYGVPTGVSREDKACSPTLANQIETGIYVQLDRVGSTLPNSHISTRRAGEWFGQRILPVSDALAVL